MLLFFMNNDLSLRNLFKDEKKYYNKDVTVSGFIRTNRDSKTFGFIVLSDGTIFSTWQSFLESRNI